MSCNYTYKGKEYSDIAGLTAVVQEEMANKKIKAPKDGGSSFVLEGSVEDINWQRTVIEVEAQAEYDSTEMLSFTHNVDGTVSVNIDGVVIKEISSTIKSLYNTETQKLEEVDISKLTFEKAGKFDGGVARLKEILYTKTIDNIIKAARSPKEGRGVDEQSVEKRLVQFAESLGFSVTSIDNYLSGRKLRDNAEAKDVEAVIDLFEKVIAYKPGDETSLTEEIAHLAFEMANIDPALKAKMLEKVVDTVMYKQFAEQYRLAYQEKGLTAEEIEQKVRKEIIGKILQQKIADNFSIENAENNAEKGIFSQLQKLWENFLSLFAKTDANQKFFKEFGTLLDDISGEVFAGNTAKFSVIDSKAVYYSLSTTQKDIHDRLTGHMENLKREYRNIASTDSSAITRRKRQLDNIKNTLMGNQFERALNTFIAILSDDIAGAEKKIERNKQLNNGVFDIETFGEVDVVSTQALLENFERYIKVVEAEIASIGKFGMTQTDANNLTRRIAAAKKSFNNIQPVLAAVTTSTFTTGLEKELEDTTLGRELLASATEQMSSSKIKDIWALTKHIGQVKLTEPLLKAVYFLIEKAESITTIHTRKVVDAFRQYVDKHNITNDMITFMYDKFHMVDKIHHTVAGEAYEADVEAKTRTLVDEIEKLEAEFFKNGKNKPAIDKLKKDLFNIREEVKVEWLEREFLPEYYKELQNVTNHTRSVIITRSYARKRILDMYADVNGKINSAMMTNKDFIELTAIEEEYKQAQSEFETDGTPKTGIDLEVALELKKYVASFAGTSFQADPLKDFEGKRRAAEAKGTKFYSRWLQTNAVMTYSDELFAKMEGADRKADGIKIDKGAVANDMDYYAQVANLPSTATLDEIVAALEDQAKEKIALTLGLPLGSSMQEVYDTLVKKKKQLTAPYKKLGEIGEIDGVLLEKNLETSTALRAVYTQLSQFLTTQEENKSGIVFKSKANEAFLAEHARLTSRRDFRALNQLNLDAGVKTIRGVETPTVSHYLTFSVEENGVPVAKEARPNFRFSLQADRSNQENPKFDKSLKGKTVQYNVENHPELINKEFLSYFGINSAGEATKNLDAWGLRELLLKTKETSDKKYDIRNQYYFLPQKYGTLRETAYRLNKGIVKDVLSKAFLVDADEEDFGSVERMSVPKRYTTKLKNGYTAISPDVISLYTSYFEAADNYKEKGKVMHLTRLVQDKIDNTHVGDHRNGAASNLANMLSEFLSVNLYGNKLTHDIRTENFLGTGRTISWGKVAKVIFTHLRNTNLMANTVTPMVGMVSASTYLSIEAASGKVVTKENMLWATKEFGKNVMGLTLDTGAINPKSKLSRLLEFSNVTVTVSEIQSGIDKGKLYRLSENLAYKQFEIQSKPTGSLAMLSIYDSYRLVNGEFINKLQYKKLNKGVDSKKITEDWNALRGNSFYNYLKQDSEGVVYFDGKSIGMSEKQSLGTEIRMTRLAQSTHNQIEGMQDSLDRAMITNNPTTAFLGIHKGWFWNALSNRFKDKQLDWQTGQEDEGSYKTFSRLLMDMMKDPNTTPLEKLGGTGDMFMMMMSLGTFGRAIEGLEEFEMANIKRAGADMYAYTALLAMAILMNASADDEEDNELKQYLAYVATRAVAEQGAIMFPTAIKDVVAMFESPVAGVNLLETVMNIPNMISNDKKVKSGKYAGKTQAERALIKATFYKNIYSLTTPGAVRGSNLFFRNQLVHIPELSDD